MTTQDILAFGCEVLGLKGALRYDDYETMVATWHDPDEKIPDEATVVEAGEGYFAAAEAEAEAKDTERKALVAAVEVAKDNAKALTLVGLQAEVKTLSKLVYTLIAERGGL